jgi:hypothetical protein
MHRQNRRNGEKPLALSGWSWLGIASLATMGCVVLFLIIWLAKLLAKAVFLMP